MASRGAEDYPPGPRMARYEIRALLPGDEEQLLELAKHLDSVNLPDDPARIAEIVELAHGS